jgi:hypothetical protein
VFDAALAAVLVRLGREYGDLPVEDIVRVLTQTTSKNPHVAPDILEQQVAEALAAVRAEHLAKAPPLKQEPVTADSAWERAFGDAARQEEAADAADLVAVAMSTEADHLSDEQIDEALGIPTHGGGGQSPGGVTC